MPGQRDAGFGSLSHQAQLSPTASHCPTSDGSRGRFMLLSHDSGAPCPRELVCICRIADGWLRRQTSSPPARPTGQTASPGSQLGLVICGSAGMRTSLWRLAWFSAVCNRSGSGRATTRNCKGSTGSDLQPQERWLIRGDGFVKVITYSVGTLRQTPQTSVRAGIP
jgi:hypothetical protein